MLFANEEFSEPCATLPSPCMNQYNMYWELVSSPQGANNFVSGQQYVFADTGMYVFEYIAMIEDEGMSWTGTMLIDTVFVGLPPDLYLDEYTICRGDSFLPLDNTYEYAGAEWDTVPQRSSVYTVWTENEYCSTVEDFEVQVIECEMKGGFFDNDPDSKGVYIPNVFSPNGDGINDVYRVIVTGNGNVLKFCVYDRWGRHVTSEYPWDGAGCSAGTYAVAIAIEMEGEVYEFIQSVILMR